MEICLGCTVSVCSQGSGFQFFSVTLCKIAGEDEGRQTSRLVSGSVSAVKLSS